MLKLKDRILLNNGISVVKDWFASKLLLNNGKLPKHIRVEYSEDASNYELKYGEVIQQNIKDFDLESDIYYDQEEFDNIFNELYKKHRDKVSLKDHQERFDKEMKFFIKNNYQGFLLNLYNMIKSFKRNDVVWGVGRGSSCASYILYLLEVHDVSPIKYDISFSEFSKETNNE